jgi:hypothetical protein
VLYCRPIPEYESKQWAALPLFMATQDLFGTIN